jgi:hypothetical protein
VRLALCCALSGTASAQFARWLGVVIFVRSAATSSALDEADDSNKFIPAEFVPMGPAEVFRSAPEHTSALARQECPGQERKIGSDPEWKPRSSLEQNNRSGQEMHHARFRQELRPDHLG